jgi:hypothetical protein
MGDSILSKLVLATFGAAIALFAKVMWEAWQRCRIWDLLTATVAYRDDGWTIQIENRSAQPIASPAATLSVESCDEDFVPTRWVGLANPDEIPTYAHPVTPKILRGPLDELLLVWRGRSNGKYEKVGAESVLGSGEVRFLSIGRVCQTVPSSPAESGPLTQDDAVTELMDDITSSILLASEGGFCEPLAILKRKRYRASLRIVSQSLPAKTFELVIDPDSPAFLTVSRVVPRASLIDRLESMAGA